jgi:hypothetical protein
VILALLLIAMVPLLPAIFTLNYPANHESFRYEQLTALFARAISHGFLYPRWLPDLAGGHGYPTFVFYQPLVFWVSAAVSALGIGPSKWMYVADYVFFVIGAAGTYRLARLYIDRIASLAVSLLFLLTPYLFVNLYIRGDHSELASSLLGTWVLWAMILAKRRFDARQRFWLVAIVGAIALAMIIMAHPATALIATPTFGFICIAQVLATRSEDRRRWAIVSCAIAALTLAVSSPYWFCVWQCGPFVHLDRIAEGYFQPHLHNVPVGPLLSGHWSFGVSHGGELMDAMATPLGLVQLLMAIAGVIAGWRNPWVRAVGLAYLGLLFLILPLSRGFWAIEHNPLRSIQFPWRLLAVTASVQVFFVVALLARIRQRWLPIVLIAAAAGWQWQMFRTAPVPNRVGDSQAFLTWQQADEILGVNIAGLAGRDQTFAGVNEFDPKWMLVRPVPRGDKPLITSLDPVEYLPGHSEHRIAARIVAQKETGVRLNQFYFPGWHVEVNGAEISDEELRAAATEDGRMLIPVPAGTSEIRAWYAGPPLAMFRLASAIVIAMGSILVLRRNQRVSPPRGSDDQSPPTEPVSL